MSDTPRTDELCVQKVWVDFVHKGGELDGVKDGSYRYQDRTDIPTEELLEHARQLERELTESRRAESDLAAETLKWKITDEALRSSCDEVAKLKRENADLLAALKVMLDALTYGGEDANDYMDAAEQQARAAIARHEHE